MEAIGTRSHVLILDLDLVIPPGEVPAGESATATIRFFTTPGTVRIMPIRGTRHGATAIDPITTPTFTITVDTTMGGLAETEPETLDPISTVATLGQTIGLAQRAIEIVLLIRTQKTTAEPTDLLKTIVVIRAVELKQGTTELLPDGTAILPGPITGTKKEQHLREVEPVLLIKGVTPILTAASKTTIRTTNEETARDLELEIRVNPIRDLALASHAEQGVHQARKREEPTERGPVLLPDRTSRVLRPEKAPTIVGLVDP